MKNNRQAVLAIALLGTLVPTAAFASLRAFPAPQRVILPSLPVTPAYLPSLPMPVIGWRRISLPNPINPMPLHPTVLLSVAEKSPDAGAAEKLGRLFDKKRKSPKPGDEDVRRDDSRLTLPENDLLNEIGVR